MHVARYIFFDTGFGTTMMLPLRRTLPLKEQYSAKKAQRHKECYTADKMKVYLLLHLPVCSRLHGGLYGSKHGGKQNT